MIEELNKLDRDFPHKKIDLGGVYGFTPPFQILDPHL
jgi:hypothetical protein